MSSYEIWNEKLQGLGKLLTMSFDDVLDSHHPNVFTKEHAKQIKQFVDELPDDLDTLFVCCNGGESRSSAMAAAIIKYKGMNESVIVNNSKYHPNSMVCLTLCKIVRVL